VRRVWYKLSCGVLVLTFTLSLCVTATASSIDNPLCDFTIIAADGTGGEFAGRINITLIDISNGNEYNYTLTLQNYLLEMPIKGDILANTTYEVKVSIPGSAEFALYDAQDGALVEEFQTTESAYVAQWVLRRVSQTFTPAPQIYGSVDVIPESQASELDGSFISQMSDYHDADMGKSFFEKFYKSVKHMDGNPAYSHILDFYGSSYSRVHASRYAAFTSGTEDEWYSLSLFERFLCYESFLQVLTYLSMGNYDYLFKTEDDYFGKVVSRAINSLGKTGNITAMNAYGELMLWQYYYTRSNGTPYNFIADISHFDTTVIRYLDGSVTLVSDIDIETEETKGTDNASSDSDATSVPSKLNQGERERITREHSGDDGFMSPGKQGGIWHKATERLKANIFTLIILFIFAGAWGGAVIYRKHNNVKVVSEN